MEHLSRLSLRHRITTRFLVVGCACILLLLAGYWTMYAVARQILDNESTGRGITLARQLAYQAETPILSKHTTRLDELRENALREEGVKYVIITDQQDQILSSNNHQAWQTMVLPEGFQTGVCESAHALIRKHLLADELVYDIGIRVPPLSPAAQSEVEARTAPETSKAPQQSTCTGTIHLGFSLQSATHRRTSLFLLTGGLSALTVLIGLGVMTQASRTLFTPLYTIIHHAQHIAGGDESPSYNMSLHNELGVLQSALSRVSHILTDKATYLKKSCKQISKNTDNLIDMSEQQTSFAEKQEHLLNQISGNVAMITETSQRISSHLHHVLSLLESFQQSAQQIKTTIHNVTGAIEDIRTQVVSNTERVVVLGEKIAQIRNVVKIITTIADQTKIIAINASIEAAGAGETGWRFSVVATEVRRLANTVVEAVDEIKDSVSSIQTATSELILSSETDIRKVDQGALLIVETDEALHSMIAMLEKTTRSAHEIVRSVQDQQGEHQQLSDGLTSLSSLSEQAAENCKRTSNIVHELRSLAEELDEMSQGTLTQT